MLVYSSIRKTILPGRVSYLFVHSFIYTEGGRDVLSAMSLPKWPQGLGPSSDARQSGALAGSWVRVGQNTAATSTAEYVSSLSVTFSEACCLPRYKHDPRVGLLSLFFCGGIMVVGTSFALGYFVILSFYF